MCLPLHKCDYISVYNLRLHYNTLIKKSYLYWCILENPKISYTVERGGKGTLTTYSSPIGQLALLRSAKWPLYWYFSITLYAWENINHLFQNVKKWYLFKMSHVTNKSIFSSGYCALYFRKALNKKLSFDLHYTKEEAYLQKWKNKYINLDFFFFFFFLSR
jgi:hypothetical protein